VPLVLVVDKDRLLVDAVAAGFRVLLLTADQSPLETARLYQPDAIVLGDTSKDLLEICESFHADYWQTPLIVVCRDQNAQWLASLIAVGVDDVLFLPITPAEMGVRIQNAISNCRYRIELRRKNDLLAESLDSLKKSEANLIQAEKLSQLGEMIAGIVHEINNPLNYSHTGLYVLRGMTEKLDPITRSEFDEVLVDITEGLGRVSHVVKDLRKFASRSRRSYSNIHLAASVKAAARLLGHKLVSVNLVIDVAEDLYVFGDENKYCQVLVNLIKNGVEATEDAGRSLDDSHIQIVAKNLDSAVELRIRDNGCGINPSQLSHVFDSFFSTKLSAKGMGLGLSICRKILEECGGSIRVESELNFYTEFVLNFPSARYVDPVCES
jgi:C4-dicarboxylate-specific signal transduction histidine kinase